MSAVWSFMCAAFFTNSSTLNRKRPVLQAIVWLGADQTVLIVNTSWHIPANRKRKELELLCVGFPRHRGGAVYYCSLFECYDKIACQFFIIKAL